MRIDKVAQELNGRIDKVNERIDNLRMKSFVCDIFNEMLLLCLYALMYLSR